METHLFGQQDGSVAASGHISREPILHENEGISLQIRSVYSTAYVAQALPGHVNSRSHSSNGQSAGYRWMEQSSTREAHEALHLVLCSCELCKAVSDV